MSDVNAKCLPGFYRPPLLKKKTGDKREIWLEMMQGLNQTISLFIPGDNKHRGRYDLRWKVLNTYVHAWHRTASKVNICDQRYDKKY